MKSCISDDIGVSFYLLNEQLDTFKMSDSQLVIILLLEISHIIRAVIHHYIMQRFSNIAKSPKFS